ncbi:MAG TPA: hypothetical protein VK625_11130 [Flavitalea sp.]|nr:hypothetical protein [Flavitalea sp.]
MNKTKKKVKEPEAYSEAKRLFETMAIGDSETVFPGSIKNFRKFVSDFNMKGVEGKVIRTHILKNKSGIVVVRIN